MIYKKFTIDTTCEAVDFISAALYEVGVNGIEIEDGSLPTEEEVEAMHAYLAPCESKEDGSARVSFYLDSAMSEDKLSRMLFDVTAALKEVSTYVDAGPLNITASETADEDFINNWKKYFHQFSVDDLLIKPTWEEADEKRPHSHIISIDPGTAFGTGSHETTKLAIRALRKYIKPGDRVLDVGCGSGILSIAALKFGASFALGTDLEEDAIFSSRENARVNDIPDEDFEIIRGNIIDDKNVQGKVGEGFNIAVANILAPVIIMLSGEIDSHIKDGGILIVSGIIDFKEAQVKEAFANAHIWEILETTHDGEWVSIVYKKRIT